MFSSGLTWAQASPQKQAPAQKKEVPAAAGTEAEPQPEAPRTVATIVVKKNLLSVELLNAEFGSVMNSIAKDSGFKVDISPDVSGRKLSTKFMDMDLDQGIGRLLTLIKEKNYMFYYDQSGMLSKVEVYGGGAPAASSKKPATQTTAGKPQVVRPPTVSGPAVSQPAPAASTISPSRIAPRRPYIPPSRIQPSGPSQTRAQQPAPGAVPQPNKPENGEQTDPADIEPVEEVPYVPAQTQPVYIPPRGR